jgi:hypothetical protein
MTQPAVPSAVSYEDVQEGNDLYRASDNVPTVNRLASDPRGNDVSVSTATEMGLG